MRAIVFDGSSLKVDAARAAPRPQAGQAIVRLSRAAISPFDLHTARGETAFRGVLGHQFVGIVEAVHGAAAASASAAHASGGATSAGAISTRKLVNQRVTASFIWSCGDCDLCRKGLAVHCRQRRLMGMCDADGCFAERFAVPVRQLALVPAAVDDDRAVFAVDVAAALHAAQQLTIVNRPFITILGDGPPALIAAQIMSRMNATVRVVGVNASRLELCDKWQVKHRLLGEVGLRNDQDIVIDCSESGSGLATALGLVRPRGKIVLKSFGAAPRPAASQQPQGDALDAVVRHEIEVLGSFAGSIPEALALLERNEIDVLSLLSRRFALRDGLAAFNAASQPDALKVLLTE